MEKNSKVIYKSKISRAVRKNSKKEEKKLEKLAEKINKDNLLKIKSVFPFDLTPDTVSISRDKVTVNKRDFFSRQDFPILVEDINTARDNVGLLFASLEIEVTGYEENPPKIKYLLPNDAEKARHYIMALKRAKEEKIDLSKINKKKITKLLDQIGKVIAEE
jgi:hypothetical protein